MNNSRKLRYLASNNFLDKEDNNTFEHNSIDGEEVDAALKPLKTQYPGEVTQPNHLQTEAENKESEPNSLPKWIKAHMVYAKQSVAITGLLGYGQYGVVHKGVLYAENKAYGSFH